MKELEVVNLEKSASLERNQEDLNLEKEVNDELAKSREDQSETSGKIVENEQRASSKATFEYSESTNVSEFVDSTQVLNNDNITEGSDDNEDAESNESEHEDLHVIVRNDLQLLKDSWANLEKKEPNDGDFELSNQAVDNNPQSHSHRRMSVKLPIEGEMSKAADDDMPDVDEQDFQVVTSKSTKKAVKKANAQKSTKSKPYITRSKVGNPKPFR
jgi:hypothetical protein